MDVSLQLAAVVLCGYIVLRVLDRAIDTAWKKSSFSTRYVTAEECATHRKSCSAMSSAEKSDLLLAFSKLEEKVDKYGKEQMKTRMMLLRYQMLNNIPENTAQHEEMQQALRELEEAVNG